MQTHATSCTLDTKANIQNYFLSQGYEREDAIFTHLERDAKHTLLEIIPAERHIPEFEKKIEKS